jgi:hypothetical protein
MQPEQGERPATSADVQAVIGELGNLADKNDIRNILSELERLRTDVATTLANQAGPAPAAVPAPTGLPAGPPPEQLVTLDQMGAVVHRSKRSLERYRAQMPPPRARGRRGRPHLWAWHEVRPWLESAFGLRLPEQFPGHVR